MTAKPSKTEKITVIILYAYAGMAAQDYLKIDPFRDQTTPEHRLYVCRGKGWKEAK